MHTTEAKIEAIVSAALAELGFEILQLRLISGDRRPTLQVMVDRLDGTRITLDECARASYTISTLLDVEDPIAGAYHLEVGSPGIDRPLTRPEHYGRFIGHDVKIELDMPMPDGRRRFRGILQSAGDTEFTLVVDKEELSFPYHNIRQSKLVLTDALIKALTPPKPETTPENANAK